MKFYHLVDKEGDGFEFDGRMLTITLCEIDEGASTKKIDFKEFSEMVKKQLGITVSYVLEDSLPKNEFFTLTVMDGSYSIINFSSCLFVQAVELMSGKSRTLTTGERIEFAGMTFQIEL